MKIALFVHCFFPDHFYGTETYTLELARHYQDWGCDVTVISAIFQGEERASELITRYEYRGIPIIAVDKNYIPHSRVKQTYYQPEMRSVLEKVLLEVRPEIVHVTHLINHTSVLLEVVGQLGIPTFATFTDFFGFCLNNKLETAEGDLCRGPSSSRANCLACYLKEASRNPRVEPWIGKASSPGLARAIAKGALIARRLPGLRHGPVDGLIEDIVRRPEILAYLYNHHYKAAIAPTRFLKNAYLANSIQIPLHNIGFGVDIERSAKPRKSKGHVPVIGFIGQIAAHKGTDLLIEAYRRLPRKSAQLRIYGPTDQSPGFMSQLRTLADGYDIQFRGTFDKDRLANVLQEIDLLVIPSRWVENSPLVLLNALATHTPVLVSNVEGMTEFVRDDINGTSFQRGSIDDMEAKLRGLLKHPENLEAISKTTEYGRTTETMAHETFNVYAA